MLQPGDSVLHIEDTRSVPNTMTVYIIKDSKAFRGHTTYAGQIEGKWYHMDDLVIIDKGSLDPDNE